MKSHKLVRGCVVFAILSIIVPVGSFAQTGGDIISPTPIDVTVQDVTSGLEWVVAIATVVGVIAAASGAILAARELHQARNLAGKEHAREAWLRFLELGFQHPEYGATYLAIAKLELEDVRELWNNESEKCEKYWWFLDIMMESCEALINHYEEKEWQETVLYLLQRHSPALEFMWKDEKYFYSEKLRKEVESVIFPKADNMGPKSRHPRRKDVHEAPEAT